MRMQSSVFSAALLLSALVFAFPAHAVIVEFSAAAMRMPVGPIGSSVKGQALEHDMNDLILNPLGADIEFGAIDGGTSAVDTMTFEGSGPAGGLTVITGFGFILRFDSVVSDVRVRFTNFKDNENRWVHAFDQNVSYVRQDPNVADNQHELGNPINFPDLNQAIDTDMGTLPVGNSDILDLHVSGNISSIVVRSNKFLWTLREIEFDVVAVPEPTAISLFGFGLAGLGCALRRRKAS